VFTLVTEADLEGQGKPTVARIRGTWNASPDIAQAPLQNVMQVFAGITLVSTKSFTAGIASLPTPRANIEWPWMWWDVVTIGMTVSAALDPTPIDITGNNRVVDSKAMRKAAPGHTMVLLVESSPALTGAPDALVSFATRILLMPS